jgi:transcriptional regulator with XRE-family HTH domain
MTPHRLENYLRTYRKETGLSQREVAFLMGCETGAQISRYERRRRLPPLKTALACEAILGIPVAELFAGLRQSVEKNIAKRRLALRSKLQASRPDAGEDRATAHKLHWLANDKGLRSAKKIPALS